jgi:hypothetical protein
MMIAAPREKLAYRTLPSSADFGHGRTLLLTQSEGHAIAPNIKT